MISTSELTVLYRLNHLILYSLRKETFIVDKAIPKDFCVKDNEAENVSNYQDLALEISQMLNLKTRVIPIVIDDSQNLYLLLE